MRMKLREERSWGRAGRLIPFGHRAWGVALFATGCASAAVETHESWPRVGVHETERVVQYAVRGRDLIGARDTMRSTGPIDDGRHQFAHTWGNFAWTWDYAADHELCRLRAPRVEVEITQTVPAWLGRRAARAAERTEWERWLRATEAHEAEHVRIIRVTATEIGAALAAVGPATTCDDVERLANAVAQARLVEMRQRHTELDRSTRHGETTAAVLSVNAGRLDAPSGQPQPHRSAR